MFVSLNGRLVSEEKAVISVFDRSFRYGDGLFEAVLVHHGQLFRWPQHLQRLARSAAVMRIALPQTVERMHEFAGELIAANQMQEAVLRIQVSRGTGPRGYAPSGDEVPMLVMSLHPAPPRPLAPMGWNLTVSSFRVVTNDPMAQHKTCNRLLQVLAAAEARERGADEALVLNTDGQITEGSTSNVFWIRAEQVFTPPIQAGALPGITRQVIAGLCEGLGTRMTEANIEPAALSDCDGVFLSFTSRGIVEADSLDGTTLRRSPIIRRLQEQFEHLLEAECGIG